MRGAPVHPSKYDGEHLDTDEKLEAAGWAAGLDVWGQVGKGYSEWYLKDDTLGNAQLWSLQEAIRAEERARLEAAGRLLPDGGETRTEWEVRWHAKSDDSIRFYEAGLPTRGHAERLGAERVGEFGTVRYSVHRREHRLFGEHGSWTGPWVEVTDA